MTCERIQDLILTDYLDGQAEDWQKKIVEGHLAECARCREFAAAAQKAVIEPFTLSQQMQPPETVWDKIQASIVEERLRPNLLAEWARMLKQILLPRPAFAFATGVVLMTLAVGMMTHGKAGNQQARTVHPREQMEYLASLAQLSFNGGNEDNANYGTMVEQYFL